MGLGFNIYLTIKSGLPEAEYTHTHTRENQNCHRTLNFFFRFDIFFITPTFASIY